MGHWQKHLTTIFFVASPLGSHTNQGVNEEPLNMSDIRSLTDMNESWPWGPNWFEFEKQRDVTFLEIECRGPVHSLCAYTNVCMNVCAWMCVHTRMCAYTYMCFPFTPPWPLCAHLEMSSSSSNHLQNAYSSLRIHVEYHFSFLNKQRGGSLKIILGFLICNIEIMLALLKSQTGCESRMKWLLLKRQKYLRLGEPP